MGRPPRAAMRVVRTMSYWATRSDCCMSVTCNWTRAIRLWTSKMVSAAIRISIAITMPMSSSMSEKPLCLEGEGRECMFIPPQ